MNKSYKRQAGQIIFTGMNMYPQIPQKMKMFRKLARAPLLGLLDAIFWFFHQCIAISPYPQATATSKTTVAPIQNQSPFMHSNNRMYGWEVPPVNQSSNPAPVAE